MFFFWSLENVPQAKGGLFIPPVLADFVLPSVVPRSKELAVNNSPCPDT